MFDTYGRQMGYAISGKGQEVLRTRIV